MALLLLYIQFIHITNRNPHHEFLTSTRHQAQFQDLTTTPYLLFNKAPNSTIIFRATSPLKLTQAPSKLDHSTIDFEPPYPCDPVRVSPPPSKLSTGNIEPLALNPAFLKHRPLFCAEFRASNPCTRLLKTRPHSQEGYFYLIP